MRRPIAPRHPLLRSMADGLVFLSLLAMVAFALQRSGLLQSEDGEFVAIDGDSLRKGNAEYRLHAIDAPELHQTCTAANGSEYPCGRDARDELRALTTGKALDCRITGSDRYRRSVAVCRAGGMDINAEMVRSGWAVAYLSHGLDYAAAQDEARRARRGIWQGRFVMPEIWRRQQRERMVGASLGGDLPPD